MMKPRTKPSAPAPDTIPPPSLDVLSQRKRAITLKSRLHVVKPTYVDGDEVPPPISSLSPVAVKKAGSSRCVSKFNEPSREGAGADGNEKQEETRIGETEQKEKSGEEKKKDVRHARLPRLPMAHSVSSSSSLSVGTEQDSESSLSTNVTSMNMENSNEISDICSLLPRWSAVHFISSSFSSSLSSLSPTPTPPEAAALVSNGDDADVEYGPPQLKDRIRELKTRFLGFRDELGRIIERLEVLEGDEGGLGLGIGDLEQGGTDGSPSDRPNFVSQASQTEDKQKWKDKESGLDIDSMGVSESGAIPGYVDTAVGVDVGAPVLPRDVSVQTDELDSTVVASASVAVQTVDVSSAIPLHATDDLTKKNLKSTLSLESKTDESLSPPTQCIHNTGSLSTLVDNLVSIKMLSMMQTLVKSSISGSSNGKGKLVESSTTANTSSESDSDITGQTSTPLSISAAMEAYDNIMSNLLDELKTIKEEARCREQSEKEDLLAMRQLHSAEVDALRRRLAYLESRNLNLGRWDSNNGGRWKGSRVDDSLGLDRPHHRFFDDRGQQPHHYGDRSQHFGLDSSSYASSVIPEGTNDTTMPLSMKSNNLRGTRRRPPLSVSTLTAADSSTTNRSVSSLLPTPTLPTAHNNYSIGVSKNNNSMGMDLDDALPLPVKSQRKHHMMALARAHLP
jgi:hypothetical protein